MQSKNIVNIIYIDRNKVILKTISMKKEVAVNRHILEFNINRRLPDCIEGAEDVLLNFAGEWMGNKLYKASCRMEEVA